MAGTSLALGVLTILALVLVVLALSLVALALFTQGFRIWVERRFPPTGRMVDVGGYRLHVVESGDPDDPVPLVFLHGASGNMRDQSSGPHVPAGRRALFVDRPGHGHSERGPRANDTPHRNDTLHRNDTPRGQADAVAAMLDALGIARAVIVGHSYGGAVAAAFALHHPARTAGLVLLSPVTHPWPGGRTLWYYDLGARPLLGRLFAHTVLVPAGLRRTACAVAGVFSPQPVPEGYGAAAAIMLALRPASFRANAADLTALHAAVTRDAPRYGRIEAPTAIVAGADDRIVWTDIHARAMAREVPGARLAVVPGLGHKPDWMAPALVRSAIKAVASRDALAAWDPAPDLMPDLMPDAIEPGMETEPEAFASSPAPSPAPSSVPSPASPAGHPA